MLVFPNCKINLGLHVTNKRPDGYHNIETVFYPVNWCDALEVIENEQTGAAPFTWSQTGLGIAGNPDDNLIFKAWQLVNAEVALPPLSVHLHKVLPMGAGLGGGSADAAFFINLLNKKFSLGLDVERRCALASQLGSDCAFFIRNQPVYAQGRGNEFSDVDIDLSDHYLLLIFPAVHSNTREAYEGLKPRPAQRDLREVLHQPIQTWKQDLVNDFETSIFRKYPQIAALKEQLYRQGAVYASLSGSGSAVFGIFDHLPDVQLTEGWTSFVQNPTKNRLPVS